MAKRYIVCLDNSNENQDQNFKKYLEEHDLAWWHWINNTWLLIDYNEKLSSKIIVNKLKEIYPDIYNLVIEVKGDRNSDNWHGFGPTAEEKNMFDWLFNSWSKS